MSASVELRAILDDQITPGLKAMQDAGQQMGNSVRQSVSVVTPEFEKLEAALQDNIFRLQAQKELLSDPVYQQSAKQAALLRAEVNELTKATMVETEATELNARAKRELIVAGRELAMGNLNRLPGTLSVLAEGEGGITGALKSAVALLGGPYVVAAGAAALATVGVSAALWKASEAEAEMVHTTDLLGKTLGVSGEAIRGFQYLAVGTGVTTEELGRVFGIFEKNLGKNADKFRELGITARDPITAFEQVMDKAKGMGDAIERNTFLNEALGRGWEKIAPVIMQGGEAAKDAMEKMKIPEDALASFERANKAQIEIDKSWMSISLHAGEAFAGIRAGFKDLEADAAKLAENHGIMAALGALTFRGRALAEAERAKNPTEGFGPQDQSGPKEELRDVLDDMLPDKAKTTRTRTSKAFNNKLDFDQLAAENATVTGPNSVRLNDSAQEISKKEAETQKIQAMEDKANARMLADVAKSQEEKAKLEQKEVDQFTKWEDLKTKTAEEEIKKRQAAQQKLFDATEAGLQNQILLMEKGKFSMRELGDVMKNMAEEAIARLIAQTVVSLAQAAITGAAWAGPAMLTSIASFGAADGAGSAAYEAAMMQAQFSGHATGGSAFGGRIMIGERGPEMMNPITPVQITPASHTTNNTYGGAVTIHIHGGDQKQILRTIRNATTNGSQSSR